MDGENGLKRALSTVLPEAAVPDLIVGFIYDVGEVVALWSGALDELRDV